MSLYDSYQTNYNNYLIHPSTAIQTKLNMSNQKSHRIDLDDSSPCKYCGKESYTEYLCYPKYGRIHTDFHRYCPNCRSYKQTDDGGCIYCPKCITMYEEKLAVRQARAAATRIEEEDFNTTAGAVFLIVILLAYGIGWTLYCLRNMAGAETLPISV